MKIKYCLVSTNLNKDYYEFIPLVCNIWKKLLDIEVKVVIIGNEIPECAKGYENNIILFDPIPNIHTAFQAQCIRVLYPCLLNTDEGIIIADIDMIPLQKDYYEGLISLSSDFFINTHKVWHGRKQIMMIGNVATPSVWKDIFKINSEDDIRNTLIQWHDKYKDYDGKRGGVSWNADQEILYNYIMNWEQNTHKLHIYDKKNIQFPNMRTTMKLLNSKKNETDIEDFFKSIYDPIHPYIQLPKPYSEYSYILDWLSNRVIIANNC